MPKIENIKLSEITPYANNPRVNDGAVDTVVASIRRYGFIGAIILNRDKVIINGHTRYKACQKLGMDTIPAIVVDHLTEEQERALRIADNKSGEIAEWNMDLLKAELKNLQDAGFEIAELGFDDSELEDILNGGEDSVARGETDPDQVPEAPEEPLSRPGEVYALGEHLLLCGDSTRAEDVAKVCPEGAADLCLTDPPYNVSYEGSNGLTIRNDSMEDSKFREFLRGAFGHVEKGLRPGGAFYIFHADSEGYNFRGACHDVGLRVRQCLVWRKNSLVLGRQDYQWLHEPCLYGWKEGAAHSWYSDRSQTTVLDFDKPKKNDVHPCLAPETRVMTAGGLKPVCEVEVGEKVLSADGRFHSVHLVSTHPYHEKIYAIRTTGCNEADMATHDHRYLVAKRNGEGGFDVTWVKAEDLRPGDLLMTPKMRDGAHAPVTERAAYCYGLWLAQGSLLRAGHGRNRYPVFTIDSRKKHLEDRIREWAGGRGVGVYSYGRSNSETVVLFDPAEGRECARLCGKGAYNKRIAEDVFAWRESLRRAFLDGFVDGDGWRFEARNEIRVHTVSPSIASQLTTLAWSVGYRPAVYRRAGRRGRIGDREFKRTLPFHDLYLYPADSLETVSYAGTVHRLSRVKSVTARRYNGDVWNLGVEGTHTFLTANGMTKNTMKPVQMLVYLLRNSSKRGDVVFDPFGGSGSTLIACEQTGRRCRTIELDPKYCDVIRRRWAEHVNGEGCAWAALTPALGGAEAPGE